MNQERVVAVVSFPAIMKLRIISLRYLASVSFNSRNRDKISPFLL